jgi:histidinol phosphatase-like PHP family hydrolase
MKKNVHPLFTQDLHIHTTYSSGDGAVVPEQTIEFIAQVGHARVIGISDHLEYLTDALFPEYAERILKHSLHVGAEVNGAEWVDRAKELPLEYYVYHCFDTEADYKGAQTLLETGKPVIIAHPLVLKTDLGKVPTGCYLELNNRYLWRGNWRLLMKPYVNRFEFVISSDAHQPNMLAQHVARFAAQELGIREKILFLR